MWIDAGTAALAIELTAAIALVAGAWIHASRMRQVMNRLSAGSWRWTSEPPGPSRGPASRWLVTPAVVCLTSAVAVSAWRGVESREIGAARAVILAVDVSQSMYVEDVAPSRIDRTRSQLLQLVRRSSGYAFGLVAFAGNAETVLPMTPDRDSVEASIEQVGRTAVAVPGSSLGQGLTLAVEAARVNGSHDVLIVSDGESTQDDELVAPTVKRAAELEIRIHSVCVGTADGGPVKATVESGVAAVRTGSDGRPIISKMDEVKLRRITLDTLGFHAAADESGSYVSSLIDAIESPTDKRRARVSLDQALVLLGFALLTLDGLGSLRK